MDLLVEVLKVDLKGTRSFELRCKAETDSNGEILLESSAVNLGGEAAGPKLTKSKTRVRIQQPHLAKFRFRFKKPSPVAALLFTAVKSDATTSKAIGRKGAAASADESETGEVIGQCLFPVTFRDVDNDGLGFLSSKTDELAEKTQTSFLSRKIDGTNINKVVGKIEFKVTNQKPVLKKSLKKKSSYLDLKIAKEKFTTPVKVGPSIEQLIARENSSANKNTLTLPGDNAMVSVIFHCAASALEEQLSDLRPIAFLGTSLDVREDIFFKDKGSQPAKVVSILKPISFQCSSGSSDLSSDFLELHLSGGHPGKVLFSAAHSLQTFYPFKHYNWEYNWRWLPGTQSDALESFKSSEKESRVILSVVYTPPLSAYAEYEGLEVLIQRVELESLGKDRNLIACVQLADNDEVNVSLGLSVSSSPFEQQRLEGGNNRNFNMAVMRFEEDQDTSSMQGITDSGVIPAYFFFAINPYFRSKSHEHSLKITLYSVDRRSSMAWWQDSIVASSSIRLPPGLKRILPNPENQQGIKCELLDEDISQPEQTPVVKSMMVVLRWKNKEMQFLSPSIESMLDKLPAIRDLVFSLPETEANSLYYQQSEAAQNSKAFVEEYKTAITKMGVDILKLRQENEQLSKDNRRLERHMIEMEASVVVTAADQRNLQPLSKADLIHRVVQLSDLLSHERLSRKGYQEKVRSLQNQLIEKNDLVSQYVKLQEAHEAQQKLVRELQSKVEKYRKCCDTSRKQESVINQLEALLALDAGDRGGSNTLTLISKENADLRAKLKKYQDSEPEQRRGLLQEKEDTISSLRKEIERLVKQRKKLEEQLSEMKAGVSADIMLQQTTKIYECEQKVKIAEARESTLMKELEENGRRWAQEKARYEIQFTELQAKLEALMMKEQREKERDSPISLAPSRPLLGYITSPSQPSGASKRDQHGRNESHSRKESHGREESHGRKGSHASSRVSTQVPRGNRQTSNQSPTSSRRYLSLDDRISF